MRLRSLLDNRSGATTIYVSIFIMIIFILIILSFVHIVGRNHAETVANQLNMQAVYAAETGIADARVRMLNLIDLANRGQIADFRSLEVPKPIEVDDLFAYAPISLGELDVILIDGQRMVISDESADSTLVFNFNMSTSDWDFLSAEPFTSDVMALKGDCLFVGYPLNNRVDIYRYDYAAPASSYFVNVTPSIIPSDLVLGQGFGSALAVNDDLIVVGSPLDDIPGPPAKADAGSVYAYKYNSTTCEFTLPNPPDYPEQKFNLANIITDVAVHSPSTTPKASQYFGQALAINSRDELIVGIPGDASFSGAFAIYKYDFFVNSTNPWQLRAYIEPDNSNFDYNTCLTGFGAYDITSSPEAFGSAVAISDLGKIAIGDPERASLRGFVGVYRYQFNEQNNADSLDAVTVNLLDCKEGGVSSEAFGTVVVLSAEDFLAIGAPGYDDGSNTDAGKAFIYQYNFTEGQYKYLEDPSAAPPEDNNPVGAASSDRLGNSLALGPEQVVVGVPGMHYQDPSDPSKTINGGFHVVKFEYQFTQAMNAIRDALESEDCINEKPPPAPNDYLFRLTDDGNVNYSCLRIDMTPELLYYEKVRSDRSLNIVLKSVNKDDTDIYENMEHLDIQWVNSGEIASPNFDTSGSIIGVDHSLPAYGQWTADASVLRVQITAFDLNSGFTREELKDNTHVFYLYPTNDLALTNRTPLSGIENGDIIPTPCGGPDGAFCSMGISDLPGDDTLPLPPVGAENIAFLVNISSLYHPSLIKMKGYNHLRDVLNPRDLLNVNDRDPDDRVKFIDIQAEISATGNAAAAQVRLSERVPLQPAYDRPEFAITSATSVCKVFVGDQDTGTNIYYDYYISVSDLPPELDAASRECDVW